ncbi:hypothetical protein D6T64_20270 [Cryobacterium melibiosiphilum]|uniref:Uncharacterized protein n=1 Tax=Cryobacterium melibiosiphilum TaxID=995039 RepID=A0A3A5MK67_9MICO|nr:hypothetical protein [Cryobacterium melibiosiphilum]RJT85249.1 hypothetical protein D6T64_20270 [Cryobacterium melibiosiphilum]
METLPPHLQNAYIARYAPGLAAKYRRNHYVVAAVIAALLIAGLVFSILGKVGTGAFVLIGILMVVTPGMVLLMSRGTETRWSADDRLALAIGDAGVVFPSLGLIAWGEMTSITVCDQSLGFRRRSIGVWTTKMLGRDMMMYVDIHVRDSEALLAREGNPGASNPAASRRMTDKNMKLTGFKGVWGEGLWDPTFQAAARVLIAEAERRGVPVEVRVPANVDTYRR